MRPLTLRKLFFQCFILAVILFFVVIVALKFGAVPVSLYALGRDLLRVLLGQSSQISSDYGLIIQNIRFPRIILAIIVGASLSVAGTSFQALLRNPLADPYVLGVSSGAALGAILGLIAEPHLTLSPAFGALLTPLFAFVGAAATITVNLSTSFQKSVYWFLAGGFLLATAVIYACANDLNILLSGEKEAMHLGVDVRRVRFVVYVAASLLTGLAVSVSGAVGYVGLIVPHIMRLIFGSDHRTLLPTAALGGAIALVIADTLARIVVAPNELAVGAVTAVVGAPLFIYLLRRRVA